MPSNYTSKQILCFSAEDVGGILSIDALNKVCVQEIPTSEANLSFWSGALLWSTRTDCHHLNIIKVEIVIKFWCWQHNLFDFNLYTLKIVRLGKLSITLLWPTEWKRHMGISQKIEWWTSWFFLNSWRFNVLERFLSCFCLGPTLPLSFLYITRIYIYPACFLYAIWNTVSLILPTELSVCWLSNRDPGLFGPQWVPCTPSLHFSIANPASTQSKQPYRTANQI